MALLKKKPFWNLVGHSSNVLGLSFAPRQSSKDNKTFLFGYIVVKFSRHELLAKAGSLGNSTTKLFSRLSGSETFNPSSNAKTPIIFPTSGSYCMVVWRLYFSSSHWDTSRLLESQSEFPEVDGLFSSNVNHLLQLLPGLTLPSPRKAYQPTNPMFLQDSDITDFCFISRLVPFFCVGSKSLRFFWESSEIDLKEHIFKRYPSKLAASRLDLGFCHEGRVVISRAVFTQLQPA